jgi:flagellar assembly protein FliH
MSNVISPAFVNADDGYESWKMPTIRARDGLVISNKDEGLGDELLKIPEFQQELEQLRETARAEGFSAGKEQGYRQGLNQGKTEIQLIGDRLNGLLNNLMVPIHNQDEALESALLNMVVSIARQVVTEEAVRSPENLRETIQSAIEALPRGADNIQIFLNPDDKKLLGALGDLPDSYQNIQTDAGLERGGCRVETHESTVDYGLNYRFRQAIAQQVHKQYSDEELAVLSASADSAVQKNVELGAAESDDPVDPA